MLDENLYVMLDENLYVIENELFVYVGYMFVVYAIIMGCMLYAEKINWKIGWNRI